jgi:hypothetical protein
MNKRYYEWLKWQEEEDKRSEMIEEWWELVGMLLNRMSGEKYCNPRDENERWFNRGIDIVMEMVVLEYIV